MGHIAKQAPKPQGLGQSPEGFWKDPVSWITEGYAPGEMEAILRNIEAKRREKKGGG